MFLLFSTCLSAQTQPGRELLYVHTDRTLYAPGETVWLRAYLTDGLRDLATPQSDVVHLDLLDATGSRVDSFMLYRGVAGHDGYLPLKTDIPGGRYTLRARTNWLGNYGPAAFYQKYLYVQKLRTPDLLTDLEIKGEGFWPGQRVPLNFTLRDRKGRPAEDATVRLALRVAGREVAHLSFFTNAAGQADTPLVLALPKDLNTTDVIITARATHEGASETTLRQVNVALNNIRLAFFPEGGYRVATGPQRIAFRATNAYGKPADVTGYLRPVGQGKPIFRFNAVHNGYGHIDLPAGAPAELEAILIAPSESATPIAFPVPRHDAFAARLILTDRRLSVFTDLMGEDFLWLRLQTEDSTFLEQKLTGALTLDVSDWPAGVYRATLLDADLIARWERLFFLRPKTTARISDVQSPSLTTPSSRVAFRLTDADNKPLRGRFSAAVVPAAPYAKQNDKQPNIVAQLLLQSQLRGKLHEPNDYFDPEQPEAAAALDDVVLCHGWRGLSWEPGRSFAYPHEQTGINARVKKGGSVIRRKVFYQGRQLLADSTGHFVKRVPVFQREELKTKPKFRGAIELMLLLPLSKRYVPQAKTGRTAKVLSIEEKTELSFVEPEKDSEKSVTAALAKSVDGIVAGVTYDEIGTTGQLEEIVVMGYSTARKSDLAGSVVAVWNESSDDYSIHRQVYRGYYQRRPPALLHQVVPLHRYRLQRKRTFAQPYRSGSSSEVRKTPVPLLGWSPDLEPDDDGKTSLDCQPPRLTTAYRIIMEGITADGTPVHAEAPFGTLVPAEFTAVLPDHATVGDTLLLRGLLRNNTGVKMSFNIQSSVSAEFRSISPEWEKVEVAANDRLAITRRVIVVRQGQGDISWRVRNTAGVLVGYETAAVTTYETAFRRVVTFGGVDRRELTTTFDAPARTGPATTQLRMYRGVEEEVARTMAGMVREPHGCFEQVTSTSYPNAILVRLMRKYPTEANVRAMKDYRRFLASGYRQLANYEVGGGGFSLWGRPPARPDLTAYGLQQFHDLREVYDGVNDKMIGRARAFLAREFRATDFIPTANRAYQLLSLVKWREDSLTAELARHKAAAASANEYPFYQTLVAHALLAAGDVGGAGTLVQGMVDEMLAGAPDQKTETLSISYSSRASGEIELLAWYLQVYVATQGYDHRAVALASRMVALKAKSYYLSTQVKVAYLKALAATARAGEPPVPGTMIVEINGRVVDSVAYGAEEALTLDGLLDGELRRTGNQLTLRFTGPGPYPRVDWRADWPRSVPENAAVAPLRLTGAPPPGPHAPGDVIRWPVRLENQTAEAVYTPMVQLGLPGNVSLLAKDLDPLLERGLISKYELVGGYLYLYLDELAAGETRDLPLDLTVELAGHFAAPPSVIYPYYRPAQRFWRAGPVVRGAWPVMSR